MKFRKGNTDSVKHFLKKPVLLKKVNNCNKSSFSKLIEPSQSLTISIQLSSQNVIIPIPKSTRHCDVYDEIMQRIPAQYIKNIIGFQTLDKNYLIDYQIHNKLGSIEHSYEIKPLYKGNKEGLQKYQICKCISIGGFSKVFLIRSNSNGQFYVGKFIQKSKEKNKECSYLFRSEKQIHERLHHKFIVELFEFLETDEFFIFVLEYCPGGQLFHLLKKVCTMNQEKAKFYFLEILYGLEYLHQNYIIYRDLKPENILLDGQGHVKIADFGLAKYERKKSYSYCGSLEYMAPQIITGNGHTKMVDYYCLGVLLYEMLVGFPPFYNPDKREEQTKQRIVESELQFPQFVNISNQAKDLIKRLSKKDEKCRLGFYGGSKEILLHPWFFSTNLKDYKLKKVKPPFMTDLNLLNFSEQQLGDSQRVFHRKIQQQLKKRSKKGKAKKEKELNWKRNSFNLSPYKSSLKIHNRYMSISSQLARNTFHNCNGQSLTKIGKLERHQTEGNKDVKMWKAKHKVGGKSKENIERITKKYLKGISNLGKVKKVNVLNCSCDNALKKV